jgi:disulfide bond formation protein DsbB
MELQPLHTKIDKSMQSALGTIVLAAAALAASRREPRVAWALIALAGVSLLIGAGIAAFHVGVEQHWWAGTSECTGTLDLKTLTPDELLNQPVVRCDAIAWQKFGISMAGYNVLYAALCGLATLWFAARGGRRTA